MHFVQRLSNQETIAFRCPSTNLKLLQDNGYGSVVVLIVRWTDLVLQHIALESESVVEVLTVDQEVPRRAIGACFSYYTHKPEEQYSTQKNAPILLIKLVQIFHTIYP